MTVHFERGPAFHFHLLDGGVIADSEYVQGESCERCQPGSGSTVTVAALRRDDGNGRTVIDGVVGYDSDCGNFVAAGNGHVTVPYPYKPGDIVRVTIEKTGETTPPEAW